MTHQIKKHLFPWIHALLLGLFALTPAFASNVQISSIVDTKGSTYNASFIIEPESVLADGQSQAVVLVFLRNKQDEPVANKEVTLTSSRPDKDDIEDTHPITGVDGVAYFKVKSQFEGTTIVTANLGETEIGEGKLSFFQKSQVFYLANSPLLALSAFFVVFELMRFGWLFFGKKRQ